MEALLIKIVVLYFIFCVFCLVMKFIRRFFKRLSDSESIDDRIDKVEKRVNGFADRAADSFKRNRKTKQSNKPEVTIH